MKELLKNSGQFLSRKQSHILSAAMVIMVTFGLSHLVGLVKTRLLISYFFGTNAASLDVYYAAYALPDTLFQLLVVGSISAAFIPIFTRHLVQNEESAWKLANATITWVVSLFFLLGVAVFFLAPHISPFIAPGFSADQTRLLVDLMRIMLAGQLLFTISGFITAILQSHQRFLIPALSPIVYNLGIILGIVLLAPVLGIFGPTIGAVFGAFLHLIIQIPLAYKLGFRPKMFFARNIAGLKEISRLMPARALALGVDQIEQLSAVIIASTLSAGSLSILNVARLLYTIPSSLFGTTIGQAALPTLSREISESRSKFSDTFSSSLLQIIYLALPVSVLFIVLRIPVVRLVFGAKSFPWSATVLTGWTLAILTIAATTTAAMQLINRGFYALHDTKTPLIVGTLMGFLGIMLSLFATQVLGFGVLGLAAAIAITSLIETAVLLNILCLRIKLPRRRILFPLIKMLITAFIMGVSLYIPMKLLDRFVFNTTLTIELIALTGITSFIGLGMYFLLSYFFRVEEFYTFIGMLRKITKINTISPRTETPVSFPPNQN